MLDILQGKLIKMTLVFYIECLISRLKMKIPLMAMLRAVPDPAPPSVTAPAPALTVMPMLPIVSVPDFETAVVKAKQAEHNYRHSSIIHSLNVDHMTHMAKEMDTTIFVKNGPCTAGLGLGGEGYLSYSIATTTGEGITTPKTFTRVRRCVLVENLRIV